MPCRAGFNPEGGLPYGRALPPHSACRRRNRRLPRCRPVCRAWVTRRAAQRDFSDLCGQIQSCGKTSSRGQASVAAPLVVVSQSRRLSAGQDTIPAPRMLLARHCRSAHCEHTTNGRILASTVGLLLSRDLPAQVEFWQHCASAPSAPSAPKIVASPLDNALVWL